MLELGAQFCGAGRAYWPRRRGGESFVKLSNGVQLGDTTLIHGLQDLVLILLIFYGLQIALNVVTDSLGIDQIDIDPMVAGIITVLSSHLFYRNFSRCVYGGTERLY